jgi:hypothetical protein
MLASATAGSVGVVVVTGLIGRFVFGLVSDSGSSSQELVELRARWERYKHRIETLMEGVRGKAPVQRLFVHATSLVEGGSLVGHMLRRPADWLATHWVLFRVRSLFPSVEQAREFEYAYQRLVKLRIHVAFFKALKRFMRVWRIWHVAMAIFLMLMIAAHISVSLYLGYWWIFTGRR